MTKPKELLFTVTKKDLEVQTFRSGGKGGQNQNKRDSGVRIIHHESGAVGEARDERSQPQNKKLALQRMVASPKFQAWVKLKAAVMEQGFQNIERKLDNLMESQNIKCEYYDPQLKKPKT